MSWSGGRVNSTRHVTLTAGETALYRQMCQRIDGFPCPPGPQPRPAPRPESAAPASALEAARLAADYPRAWRRLAPASQTAGLPVPVPRRCMTPSAWAELSRTQSELSRIFGDSRTGIPPPPVPPPDSLLAVVTPAAQSEPPTTNRSYGHGVRFVRGLCETTRARRDAEEMERRAMPPTVGVPSPYERRMKVSRGRFMPRSMQGLPTARSFRA
eukprot:TRINITY_DN2762_c0_g2_i2.p1 TRINITY_DN2762_c0_g2~~TRINITY_DN2762_c0_g2_i2.p1  ORF type:complete len:213 (+),score=49.60 TRINITY_DN2762_c0_g2_i2:83-721(+)